MSFPSFKANLRRQLKRAQAYADHREIDQLCLYLGGACSVRTLKTWLKDITKAEDAYNAKDFVAAMEQIPDVAMLEDVRYYHRALHLSGIDKETQSGLAGTRLRFKIVLPKALEELEQGFLPIRIYGFSGPPFVMFSFGFQDRVHDRKLSCRGTVIKRGNVNHLSGAGRHNVMTAYCQDTDFPAQRPSYGSAIFDFSFDGTITKTDFAIVPLRSEIYKTALAQARARLDPPMAVSSDTSTPANQKVG